MVDTDKKTNPRQLQGIVVSNKMEQTIVLKVARTVAHKMYGKMIRKTTKVHAHDPENSCSIGDLVIVRETKPISKTKTWKLVEIKEKAVS